MLFFFFFFQAEDGIRDYKVTGVQTCALPISGAPAALGVDGGHDTADPRELLRAARARRLHGGRGGGPVRGVAADRAEEARDAPGPARARGGAPGRSAISGVRPAPCVFRGTGRGREARRRALHRDPPSLKVSDGSA